MVKKKDADTRRIPKMFYLPPDIARRLKKAADATHLSQSSYVVQTLKDRFKKDGIE
jgi:predicted transcriptional regulator